MKKSRTLPALLSLVLALAMMLSLSVTAFAASPARASGNGYSMTTMKVNGKYYDIAASTGETNKSAYTAGACTAIIRIRHSAVGARFDTTHYGYVSQSVGASNTQTTANNPYTRSNLVVCRYGVDEVERITYIHGGVTFYGDSATTLNVTLKNP